MYLWTKAKAKTKSPKREKLNKKNILCWTSEPKPTSKKTNPPKTIPKLWFDAYEPKATNQNRPSLFLLYAHRLIFVVLVHCFLFRFWIDRPVFWAGAHWEMYMTMHLTLMMGVTIVYTCKGVVLPLLGMLDNSQLVAHKTSEPKFCQGLAIPCPVTKHA